MNVYRRLQIHGPNGDRVIIFGEANTKEEITDVYRLRYNEYLLHDYIDPSKYSNDQEIDEYDMANKCRYFIAMLSEAGVNRIIGCIRLIIDDPLPTEKDFLFTEPSEIKCIPRINRAELGRFIIIPPNRERGDYLPRGITMLFLLNVLSDYGMSNQIFGGYAFIKESLKNKLLRAKFPVHLIQKYIQRYPKDGVLTKYFNQPHDPVVPIYFITKEFQEYTAKVLQKRLLFKKIDRGIYIFKQNMFTKLLQMSKLL